MNPRCMLLRIVSSVAAVRAGARGTDPALSVYSGVCVTSDWIQRNGRSSRASGSLAEELAVEVDADPEPRVVGHHLNGGRAAQRMADDPDVLQIEVAGER